MTTVRSRTSGSNPPDGDRSEVRSVADAVTELLRTMRRSKARQAAVARDDVESATQMLLRTVSSEGPMRASALAVAVNSDLSTVSRQVASLVGRGLLERRADQDDGRASLLVVTDAGQAVIAAHDDVRDAFFDRTLDGWRPEERRQFALLLGRFTVAYDETHRRWIDESRRSADPEPASTPDPNRPIPPDPAKEAPAR